MAGLLTAATAIAADPVPDKIDVQSRLISQFKMGSSETRFGPLEFLGGIEMSSPNSLFGSLSSIRLRPDHARFIGVLDTGHWMTGVIERDGKGMLSGINEVRITAMRDRAGRVFNAKGPMDAEGLAVDDGRILVSFEGKHRIEAYPASDFEMSRSIATLPFPIPNRQMKKNKGLETLAVAPVDSPLRGSPVAVCEESFDRDGELCAAVLDGPLKGRFSVVRKGDFDPTDGTFLPNGDLLLLERRFSLLAGVGMQLRLIDQASIRPGAVVDGKILMTADSHYEIDNMEGLDVFQADDGSTHVIIVSDDNNSFLQRNIMLEFRLHDQ
ncbi:esterase-like activity of phytase family protein [Oryzifoliimicrobium ureilyticus]|uniref:esterase-like activity of phytase family protein n=1 Tax=Oryzifoliimicrobium ureilyticus TaxID=3113724 RepID=UPI003076778F